MNDSSDSIFVNMEARKTFRETLRFQKSAPAPRFEALAFWDETVARWHREGLPENQTPWEYFGIDRCMDNTGSFENPSSLKRLIDLVFRVPYWPLFETKIIEEKEEHVIKQDEDGVIKKVMKHGVSMPQFLKFPVENRQDWEKIKRRLNPENEERYSGIRAAASSLGNRRHILRFGICGGYGFLRNLFGEEGLAYVFYDLPGLLHDIMKHWLCFQTAIADRICPLVDFDYVFIWEDMAFKTASFISPDLFREFMFPYLKEFIGHVSTRHHLDLFMVDSDGNNLALLPLFMEAGVNVFMPCEIAAGMEPTVIRRQFPDLALLGGIDKRALLKGKNEVEAEIMKKAPLLAGGRGYIPSVDHAVPPDVSFDNFCHYVKIVREITGGVC